jgi:AraC-like DNA-binding protein
MRRIGTDGLLSAIFVSTLLREATRLGGARAELLRQAGLSEADLVDDEAMLPIERVFAAWAAAMRLVRDDGLPIVVARTFELAHYPLLGFAAMTAPSVREALGRVVRFSRLLTTSGQWSLEESGTIARLRWSREGPRTLGQRVANESVLAEMLHGIRQTVGRDVAVIAVSFRHPAPADLRAHAAHFGARLAWSQPFDELALPRPLLDDAPRYANPALATHFEHQVLAALRQADAGAHETVVERTRRLVGEALLGGEPVAAQVAKRQGMSERTLRRALAAEQASFRELVEEVRRARAEAMLDDPRRSLAEVALSLGFSELSAFSRAYKRWTGRAPSRSRAALGH